MDKLIEGYLATIKKIVGMIDKEKIESVINMLEKARLSHNRIFILGNGGSATTANHFVCDFGKNAIKGDEGRFKIISLCDNMATITAYGNDFAYERIFEERLKNLMEEKDIIMCISASGNSKNVINAVQYAKKKNGYIISLTGFDGGKLKNLSDLNINIHGGCIEQIEDVHLMIEHIIVYCYKNSERLNKVCC